MSAPVCGRCGTTLGWSIGLPVSVVFSEDGGVATVCVDTGELDDSDGYISCGNDGPGMCVNEGPVVSPEAEAWLHRMLAHVSEKFAPELDCELPE